MARSDDDIQRGQRFDSKTGAIFPYTRQIQNCQHNGSVVGMGDAATEVTPNDNNSSVVEATDETAVAAALESIHIEIGGTTSFPLPKTLLSVTVVWNSGSADGVADHPVGNAVVFGTGSASLNPRSSVQGNASATPALIPVFRNNKAENVPSLLSLFYSLSGLTYNGVRARVSKFVQTATAVTLTNTGDVVTLNSHGYSNLDEVVFSQSGTSWTQGLTKDRVYYVRNKTANNFQVSLVENGTAGAIVTITADSALYSVHPAVKKWPRFSTDEPVFVLAGKTAAVQSSAEANFSIGGSTSSGNIAYNKGKSYSKDLSFITRTEPLPECIHGVINLAGDLTKAVNASAYAYAETPAIGTVIGIVPRQESVSAVSLNVTASVTPTSLAATTLTDIPTSGLYLKDISLQTTEHGHAYVRCEMVDFSYFA